MINYKERVVVPELGPCYEKQGARSKRGYGLHCGKSAHRLVYFWCYPETDLSLVIRHKCDNPPCINPSHLIAGTQQENLQDARDRGRARAANGLIPVASDEVEDMRAARAMGLSISQIAALTGRSRTSVHRHLTISV